ncbi:methyl-CpG-binding domain protein 1b isoform X2 [Kryptolebias marmoratus]|uniref:Methyl-CpG binding domain protein 1b n=1 Tax=Kryptolebias marmoratus TaxID=37003 RepID=A0A3Q3BEC3_KRYMA|nr:methyl-CpG-binding domain protein 1b isoform X2 [Kryptolebias marmoratus]
MNKEGAENRLPPGNEPVEEDDVGLNAEESPEPEEGAEETPGPFDDPKETASLSPNPAEDTPTETEDKDDVKAAAGEPMMDWFEPLEDDDDPDDESLAGETESVAGSERAVKKLFIFQGYRRRRSHRDEGWDDWPVLGQGWKRKEVVRRSGSSIGQKDVYYLGPRGERVRSRVELATVLQGQLDLTNFEYKSGKFYEGEAPPIRIRNRIKKRYRERSSSESSWMERGDGAETPDSFHRLTPNLGPRNLPHNQTTAYMNNSIGTNRHIFNSEEPLTEEKIRLPPPSSSRLLPLPSIKGEFGSEDSILDCAKCGSSFTGTWYDKQRKKPCCPACWALSKAKVHPMIRFRKWIPCGQCVGCHNTFNCGQCANCKHGLQSPEAKKRLCRKRRCICPIRKNPESRFRNQMPYDDGPETYDDNSNFQTEFTDSQHPSFKSSDTENFSVNVDLNADLNVDFDEDEMSTDDDDDWHKKRKRRSCGECKACLCRKDCGTCDFCVDKPKFGGSNKKRQKCRLRQCQRQAMRHLLPFQMGGYEYGPDGTLPGRPKPHYTYSRKSSFKRNRGPQTGLDLSDNEDDDINLQPLNHSYGAQNGLPDRVPHIGNHNYSQPSHQSRWGAERSHTGRNAPREVEEDDEEFPMITQIFSLADNPNESSVDHENQLMKLLHSLRSSVLPILWYAIMVEGPQLQLIQCSKQSNMADTIVLINPGFYYYVTVQKQPLLPIHPVYDKFPGRLTTATEVVSLLLALERYNVCRGLPPKESSLHRGPIILERASTCDFLVAKSETICANCRTLKRLQI